MRLKFCTRTTTTTPVLKAMESLNLNALAGSLPTSNLASAEKELLNNFRGKNSLCSFMNPTRGD